MKKVTSSLLIIIILFNFIFSSGVAYADESSFKGISTTQDEVDKSVTSKKQESLVNEGTTENNTMGGVTFVWDMLSYLFGAVAGILALIVNVVPMGMQGLMSFFSENLNYTIEETVFNEIKLFDINYFNFNKGTDQTKKLKKSVAKWYYILRLIVLGISLVILIYVGIRMALSTISSDKAKYKKMLVGWVESIIILFVMQYIISILLSMGSGFSNILSTIRGKFNENNQISFEDDIIESIFSFMFITSGWNYVVYSILYWILIFTQTKFFLSYFKRVINVGFLILIAPLVVITYPIDKIGDGKAQAFSVWLSELSLNIFIQPIHALIYLVFMYTAGEIAKKSMLVALIFLLYLTKVEKTIFHLFNLKTGITLKAVADERKK